MYYTAKETAEILGYKLSYLYKLTHLKRIRYFKPFGKKIFFSKDCISEFVQKNFKASPPISYQLYEYRNNTTPLN